MKRRDREVIGAASRKLKPKARSDRKQRTARHAFHRTMLACHGATLELVIRFRV